MVVSYCATSLFTKDEYKLDTNKYETGKKVSDKEFEEIHIVRDEFHGELNYAILPE